MYLVPNHPVRMQPGGGGEWDNELTYPHLRPPTLVVPDPGEDVARHIGAKPDQPSQEHVAVSVLSRQGLIDISAR